MKMAGNDVMIYQKAAFYPAAFFVPQKCLLLI
jgi:hypothetical protein